MADICLAERSIHPVDTGPDEGAFRAPGQVAHFLPHVSARPPVPEQRGARLVALREQLHDMPELLEAKWHADLRGHLFAHACACDDWPLVAHLGFAMDAFGELSPDALCRVAEACWRMGDIASTVDLLRRVLLQTPRHRQAVLLSDGLHAWFQASRRAGRDIVIDDDTLSLQPLEHHHVDDFRWHYADPSMIDLCCLPDFVDDDDWHDWLDEIHQEGDQALFGIWHRHWGFMGCVSLIFSGDLGLFYYWIGRDFRGAGHGPRAAQLLLEHARTEWGMRACYAKVYAHNHPSLRALAKIGFVHTGIPILRAGAAPEHLVRWPEADGVFDEEAWSFLQKIDATTQVLSLAAGNEALSHCRHAFRRGVVMPAGGSLSEMLGVDCHVQ
ncbi:GNAT family protein [Oleiagrimonas sp. MCCC 1A03011]|uniref:GNAT family N-acetyltransferase n=1 Tax=Oleiagrimonas sp. MCCC 1A03011 TaxID=1926883 RepID=UPI000DDA04F7|nr:GNAT family protein [Oleiagrimonas sp. MCCC 1A03011]